MKRYDCHIGEYFERPEGAFIRFEDHQEIIRIQANAARSGMEAAKAISSHQFQAAAKARAASRPEALESERAANDRLTRELEAAHGAERAAEAETIRALAAHAIEIARLTQELTDACHDIDRMTQDHLQYSQWVTPQLERLGRELVENDRLLLALRGIASCSTCEACQGAAEIALEGLDPHIPSWPPRYAEHGDICWSEWHTVRADGWICEVCGDRWRPTDS